MIRHSLVAAAAFVSVSAFAQGHTYGGSAGHTYGQTPATTPAAPVATPATETEVAAPAQSQVVPPIDLTLDEPRWHGVASGFVCDETGRVASAAPAALADISFVGKQAFTDFTLDNGNFTASFVNASGASCSYSAIVLADNANLDLALVESRAYALDGSSCVEGKAVIDTLIGGGEAVDYWYYGRPHHIAIVVATEDAAAICGEGATHVGIDYTLKGRL